MKTILVSIAALSLVACSAAAPVVEERVTYVYVTAEAGTEPAEVTPAVTSQEVVEVGIPEAAVSDAAPDTAEVKAETRDGIPREWVYTTPGDYTFTTPGGLTVTRAYCEGEDLAVSGYCEVQPVGAFMVAPWVADGPSGVTGSAQYWECAQYRPKNQFETFAVAASVTCLKTK